MDSSYRKLQWNTGWSQPQMWEMIAGQLVNSAEILWNRWSIAVTSLIETSSKNKRGTVSRDIGLCTIAFMLAGFALENVLKGLCVSKFAEKKPIVEGDKRLKDLKTHNLKCLAGMAEISINKQQRELLDKLETEVLWGGRYPRPNNFSDFFPEIKGKPGKTKMRSLGQNDWDDFIKLFNKLYKELKQASKDDVKKHKKTVKEEFFPHRQSG